MFSCIRYARVFAAAALALVGGLHSASAQWAERFDTLIGTGASVAPNKCWDLWDQAAAANSVTSATQALSAPNSILITGTSDTIQRFSGITSGIWDFTTHVYVPSNSTGRSWLILMNKYLHGVHANQDWSVQITFNAATNAIFSQEANVTGTLIEDAWFQVRVRINLNTNLAQIYVNNVLFASHPWVGPNGANGLMQIQCLDLYAEAATSIAYHDNISLVRVDHCCVEIDPGTKNGNPFLYDTPMAQTFKPQKTGLACEILTGLELDSVPSYDFFVVNAPFGVVPTNYATTNLYSALNQTQQNTNGIGPVNAMQTVLNSNLVLWANQTYAIVVRKTAGANLMWRATAADTYPNGKAWVWDGGMWNLGTSGYGIADFTFSITGLVNRRARRCGYPDNCALPFDNVWRSPALNGVYPGAPWKKFDDPTSDMWVGHTFRNLPNNIVRARLRFAAKPDSTNGGTFNDAITVGLCNNPSNPNPPPYWMFSRRLEALPEAMGHWDTNPKTTFTLDLHNLPDGGNIIGMMNASGMLDMWIVDDTMVDWATLEIWTCPPKQAPFGLPMDVLGNPDVGPWDPVERRLPVRNLGSSGEDGVSIELGEANGFKTELCSTVAAWSANGSDVTVRAVGPSEADWDLAKNIKVRLAGAGSGQVQLNVDLSELGTTLHRAEFATPNGTVVGRQMMANNTPITIGPLTPTTDYTISIYIGRKKDGSPFICIVIHLPDDWFANGIAHSGVKSVLIEPEDGSDSLSFVRRGITTASNRAELFINHASAGMFFDVFTECTTPLLDQSGDVSDAGTMSSVTNIGSSGQDGVRMKCELGIARSSFFDIFVDADLDGDGVLDEGSGIRAEAFGSFNGSPNHPLGSIRYRRIGSFFDVFADFSDIGVVTKRIEVWNGNTMVGAIPGFVGDDIGTTSNFPIRIGKLGWLQTKCISSDFPTDTVFLIGGQAFVGNNLRVLAESVGGTIDHLESFNFEALNATEMMLWNANRVPMTRTVSGTIQLQDYEGGPQPVLIEIRTTTTLEVLESHVVNVDATGGYSFETGLAGNYNIGYKGIHWLRRAVPVTISGEGVTQNVSLVNGDVDNDNENTLVDYGRIAAAFGKAAGEPGFDEDADLNGDGEVNLVDVGIIAANFGDAGDE